MTELVSQFSATFDLYLDMRRRYLQSDSSLSGNRHSNFCSFLYAQQYQAIKVLTLAISLLRRLSPGQVRRLVPVYLKFRVIVRTQAKKLT